MPLSDILRSARLALSLAQVATRLLYDEEASETVENHAQKAQKSLDELEKTFNPPLPDENVIDVEFEVTPNP
jgi:hypothetical protein|tara:strand:- start:156 stop:371 length:216 start_codon:yes stop_codon:yes gene_type:complete